MAEYTTRPIPGGTHRWLLRDGLQLGIIDDADPSRFCPKKNLPQAELDAAMAAIPELLTACAIPTDPPPELTGCEPQGEDIEDEE